MPVPQVGLISYVFFINRRGRSHSFVNLNSFGAGGSLNFKNILVDFLASISGEDLADDEVRQKTWQLHEYEVQPDYIQGTILSGLYGDRVGYVNRLTRTLSYQRTEDDAEIRSFHFYIETPTSDTGEFVASFQTYDFNGIKTEFEARLKDFFANYDGQDLSSSYTFHMKTIVPSDYVRQIAERVKIKKVRFIKYNERMGINAGEERNLRTNVEIIVKAPKRASLPLNERLIDFINGNTRDITGVFLLPEGMQDLNYNDVKLDVKDNGRAKTINLRTLDLPRFAYNVDEDNLYRDENGYIDIDTIYPYARSLVADLRSTMSPRQPEDDLDE